MPRRNGPPALVHHKPRNVGRVCIDGRHIYLGPWGSPECQANYDAEVRKWRLAQADTANLTVDLLALRHLEWAESYYRRADGSPTGETGNIRAALRPLIVEKGTKLVRTFGPPDLLDVRETMVRDGLARKTINARINKIRAAFKRAVEVGDCPGDVWHALQAVSGLRAGRSPAPETKPMQPVPVDVVEKTLPHLPRPIAGAVLFQLFTACRPTEALQVRAVDIDMTGDDWLYTPPRHKTEHHGRSRIIPVGPPAQRIVREFLVPQVEAPLFSPRLVSKRGKATYTKASYLRAVMRGCERAFGMPEELRYIPARRTKAGRELSEAERQRRMDAAREWRREHCWCPLQLRHTTGTAVRRGHGLEAAQVVLGHARADVTQVYAEANVARAVEIARDIDSLLGMKGRGVAAIG